ncbi:hypothetical protein BH09BAC2_BH09BAC2_12110 [soil metagenome]
MFAFIYTETKKQVLTLIIAPLLIVFSYLYILFELHVDQYLPWWLSTFLLIALIAISMWWLLNKVAARKTDVIVTDNSIDISLEKTNFLFTDQVINVSLNNIKKFSSDINQQAGNRSYFTITTIHPARSFTLSQPKLMADNTAAEFENLVNAKIAAYNETSSAEMQIKQGSFFDAPWVKVFNYIAYAAMAVVTIAVVFGKIPWYQMVRIYCFSILWISISQGAKRKKKVNIGT